MNYVFSSVGSLFLLFSYFLLLSFAYYTFTFMHKVTLLLLFFFFYRSPHHRCHYHNICVCRAVHFASDQTVQVCICFYIKNLKVWYATHTHTHTFHSRNKRGKLGKRYSICKDGRTTGTEARRLMKRSQIIFAKFSVVNILYGITATFNDIIF